MQENTVTIGKHVHEGFTYTLILYLVCFLLENLFTGFVSNAFDLNILLIPLFILGIATSFFPTPIKEKSTEVTHGTKEYIMLASASILTFIIIYTKLADLGAIRLWVAVGSSVFIAMVSAMMLFFPEETIENETWDKKQETPDMGQEVRNMGASELSSLVGSSLENKDERRMRELQETWEMGASGLSSFAVSGLESRNLGTSELSSLVGSSLETAGQASVVASQTGSSLENKDMGHGTGSMGASGLSGLVGSSLESRDKELETGDKRLVTWPKITVPNITLPTVRVKVPRITFPTLTMPRVSASAVYYVLWIIPLLMGLQFDNMRYAKIREKKTAEIAMHANDKPNTVILVNRTGGTDIEKYKQMLASKGFVNTTPSPTDPFPADIPNTTVLFRESEVGAGDQAAQALKPVFSTIQTGPLIGATDDTIVVILVPETL